MYRGGMWSKEDAADGSTGQEEGTKTKRFMDAVKMDMHVVGVADDAEGTVRWR